MSKRKLMSFVLAICMVILLMPTVVYADEFLEGGGGAPVVVTTVDNSTDESSVKVTGTLRIVDTSSGAVSDRVIYNIRNTMVNVSNVASKAEQMIAEASNALTYRAQLMCDSDPSYTIGTLSQSGGVTPFDERTYSMRNFTDPVDSDSTTSRYMLIEGRYGKTAEYDIYMTVNYTPETQENPDTPVIPDTPVRPTTPTTPKAPSTPIENTFKDRLVVKTETDGNTATLSWEKIDGADKYIIYQYKNEEWVKIKTTTELSATFKKLKNGKDYKFLVRYIKDGKLSPESYSGECTANAYYKPIVKATATENSVRLTWEEVPGAEKYAVYKYVNGKAVKLAETEKRAIRINKLKSDKEYSYIVCAYVDGEWTTMQKSDIVIVKTTAE